MLYRKISRLIEDHLRAQDPRILLVDGARQVGKTYIIRYVGKQLFENFIEVNMVEDSLGERLFAQTRSVEDFYLQLSMLHGDKMKEKQNTLNQFVGNHTRVRIPPAAPDAGARTETSLPLVFKGRHKMAPVTKEQALKSALASSAVEGFPVTPEVMHNCQRLLNGEVNVDSLVKEILSKRQKG
mgnify:CR=1 FL=1